MARISKMAAAVVGAGVVAMAGNTFVNPTPPSTLPNNVQSYAASRPGVAADEETSIFEEQTSYAGLFAGVMLGMLVGFTGGVGKASAEVESPTTGLLKELFKQSRMPDGHSEWNAMPNDFDKNVNSLLSKKLEYLDVDKNFNPEGIGDKFAVDKSQMPVVTLGKLMNVKNDPAARIGDGDSPAPAAAAPKASPKAKEEPKVEKKVEKAAEPVVAKAAPAPEVKPEPVVAKPAPAPEPVVAKAEAPPPAAAAPAEAAPAKKSFSFFKKKN